MDVVTEAGAVPYGITKSAVGLGAILLQGIGDTIRVSLLTERKEDEMLREELPGYEEYVQRVRYRLIPGGW